MSTSITGASSREPTQRRLKTRPTSSAVLWGHLLSNNDVSRTASSSRNAEGASATALSTITPVDKTGTSLRILLHDTQANLEKFSERVGKLTGDIDESKREIGAAKALLQQDHEKTVEEIVDLVNRCQLAVQRTVGVPAQAEKVEDMRTDLAKVDTRLTALETKMDMLQMLNQTQLQALQTVQTQQGKLIAAISPVLPLLQGIAPHLENLRRDLSDGFRDIHARQTAVAAVPGAPAAQSPRSTPSHKSTPECPSDSARRKKRKYGYDKDTLRTPNDSGLPNGANFKSPGVLTTNLAMDGSTPSAPLPGPAALSASPDVPLQLRYARPNPYRTPRRPPLVDLLNPNATPGPSRFGLVSTTQNGVSALATHAESLGASARASRSPGGPSKADGGTALSVPKPFVQGTPKNADSLASTTSTLSQSSVARHNSIRAGAGDSSASGIQSNATLAHLSSGLPVITSGAIFTTPARQGLQHNMKTSHIPQLTVAPNGFGTPITNKPLSIKDIRALTATPALRNEGKRFIPLDDDDDNDLVE